MPVMSLLLMAEGDARRVGRARRLPLAARCVEQFREQDAILAEHSDHQRDQDGPHSSNSSNRPGRLVHEQLQEAQLSRAPANASTMVDDVFGVPVQENIHRR